MNTTTQLVRIPETTNKIVNDLADNHKLTNIKLVTYIICYFSMLSVDKRRYYLEEGMKLHKLIEAGLEYEINLPPDKLVEKMTDILNIFPEYDDSEG